MDYKDMLKLDNQLCFPMYAASRIVMNTYTPFLKPLKLTYTQYLVMLVLWEEDGITVGNLGHRLLLDNGTLSPLLKKMENLGYVERIRSEDDERRVNVFLTEEGRSLQDKASHIPLSMMEKIKLDEEKARDLYKLLKKFLSDNQ